MSEESVVSYSLADRTLKCLADGKDESGGVASDAVVDTGIDIVLELKSQANAAVGQPLRPDFLALEVIQR